MARPSNLNEKCKTPILLSIAGTWNTFLHRNKVNEVCVWLELCCYCSSSGPLWMRQTQTFNDYMQDYTNLKIKIGDSIIHLQIKMQVCPNRNVHFQLVPMVSGTGITTITVLLCQTNT